MMKKIIIILYCCCFTNNILLSQSTTVVCIPNPFTVRYRVDTDLHNQYEYLNVNPDERISCPEYDGWVMVFNDEFNDIDLNRYKWNYTPPYRQINEAHNYFTNYPTNANINSGHLSMWFDITDVDREAVDGDPKSRKIFQGTGALIQSKMRLPAGKLESRYKMPLNKYSSGAIWQNYNNWQDCYEEIDGMEYYVEKECSDAQYFHSIRMNLFRGQCGGDIEDMSMRFESCTPNMADDWFLLDYDWDVNHVDWKLNNKLIRRMSKWVIPGGLGVINPCIAKPFGFLAADFTKMMPNLTNMNIMLDSHASDKCEDELPGTPYPANFDIDYVRYYVKINCEESINIHSWRTTRDARIIENEDPTVYAAGIINVAGSEGDHIIVHGSGTLFDQENQFLTLIATDEINLEDGFEVLAPDGNFEAKAIECNSQYIIPFDTFEVENYQFDKKSNVNNSSENNLIASQFKNNITSNDNLLVIYPNPAQQNFVIESYIVNNENATIQLFNSLGELTSTLLKGEKINGYQKKSYDISNLANGVYSIKIQFDSGENIISKIIIQN